MDTIAAIATANGSSGVGIIRISGEEAFPIADRVVRLPGGKNRLSDAKSHTIHYGFVCEGEESIDEALILLMRAPRSFIAGRNQYLYRGNKGD